MSAKVSAPGAQQQRFAAYLDSLAQAAEHTDRVEPLKSYCKGLLLPGERKSVEPMAARLAPDNVRQTPILGPASSNQLSDEPETNEPQR
jgi:SRSO17 transposase